MYEAKTRRVWDQICVFVRNRASGARTAYVRIGRNVIVFGADEMTVPDRRHEQILLQKLSEQKCVHAPAMI